MEALSLRTPGVPPTRTGADPTPRHAPSSKQQAASSKQQAVTQLIALRVRPSQREGRGFEFP